MKYPTSRPPLVTVPRSQVVDITSKINGRTYRLLIAQPLVPAPEGGYPVLYVLDGHGYFGLATDASRNRSSIGREIEAPLVVGLGYPDDDPTAWHRHRMRDLSPTVPGPGDRTPPGFTSSDFGGLDEYLEIIEREVKPAVAALHAVDARNTALFGHSMGGLAVLHALITRPHLFTTFLAVSPAIWWNERVVLRHEAELVRRLSAGETTPRIFIGVGGREETVPETIPSEWGMSRAEIVAEIERARMVGNARELACRLRDASGAGGPQVLYVEAASETHITVPFAAFRAALDLAFPVARAAVPPN